MSGMPFVDCTPSLTVVFHNDPSRKAECLPEPQNALWRLYALNANGMLTQEGEDLLRPSDSLRQ